MNVQEKRASVYCPVCRDFSPHGSITCMNCGARVKGTDDADSSLPKGKAAAFGVTWDPVIAALWILALGILYALVFILPLAPMHSPLIRLVFLYAAVSFSTAAMVFIDCAIADPDDSPIDSPDDRFNYTPARWFAFVLLAWPLGFPLYFWNKARQYPDRSSGVALAEAAIFVLAFLLTWAIVGARYYAESSITGPMPRKSASPAAQQVQPRGQLKINGQAVQVAGKGTFIIQTKKTPNPPQP